MCCRYQEGIIFIHTYSSTRSIRHDVNPTKASKKDRKDRDSYRKKPVRLSYVVPDIDGAHEESDKLLVGHTTTLFDFEETKAYRRPLYSCFVGQLLVIIHDRCDFRTRRSPPHVLFGVHIAVVVSDRLFLFCDYVKKIRKALTKKKPYIIRYRKGQKKWLATRCSQNECKEGAVHRQQGVRHTLPRQMGQSVGCIFEMWTLRCPLYLHYETI